nr:hypothetical protein [uncultured Methanoregula sp.]
MSIQNLSISPSFGITNEENQIFTIQCKFHYTVPDPGHQHFSFCFVSETGRRINLDINSAEFSSDMTGSSQNPEKRIVFSASANLSGDFSEKCNDRTFDLVLFNGSQEIERQKNAFKIYDSIAVLIHGFLASPQTYQQLLVPKDNRILFLIFDYEYQNFETAIKILPSFNTFVEMELTQKGYTGRFDIVCHSMGAQISRLWMLNYPENNNTNATRVRQWIGVAPVNHGSAGADGHLADIVAHLLNRPAFTELKTRSTTTHLLACNEKHERENPIRYRIIIGYNGKRKHFFYVWYEKKIIPQYLLRLVGRMGFPEGLPIPISYDGKTLAYNSSDRVYFKTYYGDGVVANFHSLLSFASTDAFDGLNHSTILRDSKVCALIRRYLISNPELQQNHDFEKEIERDYLSH